MLHYVEAMLRSGCHSVALVAFIVVNFVCGCAGDRHRLVLDPIGPESGGRVGVGSMSQGYLQVFSATERHDDGGIVYYPHTSYSIYAQDGKRVQGVANSSGHTDQRPATVELPGGAYLVYAQSERFGQVKVPVQIVGSRLTVVHLEGTGMRFTGNIPESELVRLPDGIVAGRRVDLKPAPPSP
jgi:hypothetical protein